MTHNHESSFEPAQFLVENIELLPKGRVLDVAMGSGRNAIYLARLGFDVEGVDMSPEAINIALELTRKAGVTIKAQVADLQSDYLIEKVLLLFLQWHSILCVQLFDGIKR